MADAKVAEKSEKQVKTPPTFNLEVVATDLVASVSAVRKPVLADAVRPVVEKFKDTIAKGEKSDWMLQGEATATQLRSAFKYHGYSVGFGETKEATKRPVFRIIGTFESRSDKKARLEAEKVASDAKDAAA